MEITCEVAQMKKLVLTVAQTGGLHGKALNPALPEQPDEIAQSAYDCYNAGASVCHIHVRDKEGGTTGDMEIYSDVLRKIKAKCPIITQVGNGIGGIIRPSGMIEAATLEERMPLTALEPKPDMLTINMGTFEFGHVAVFDNPMNWNANFVRRCNERNIPIECECYDMSHIFNTLELVRLGVLKEPVHFSLVLGVKGGMPFTPKLLSTMVDCIPEGSSWQVITLSKHQLPATVMAMCQGANIRTGLEDNIYYSKGELAKSNAQLVERMVRIAREIGREIATVDEAKEMLGITS
ncbi:MAG: 3-keto-5-aminohexanoate cleavage protein [Thermodesulfobacteriota bacterium]